MITSVQQHSDKMSWIVPKGGWEIHETKEQAAVRETLEEAGVTGELDAYLGDFVFQGKKQSRQNAYMYLLRVTEEMDTWEEVKSRERRWYSMSAAMANCSKEWMREALARAQEIVNSSSSEGSVPAEDSPES